MADLRTEQQITEELRKQKSLRDDGRQSDATREARLNRIKELEKELSTLVTEQVKAKKLYNKIASDANKIEKDTNKSIVSRLQSLAKGDMSAIFQNKAAEKQQSLQSKINIEAKSQADVLKDKLTNQKISATTYQETLSLVSDIKSGLIDQEDISGRILNINDDGQDIARALQNDFEELADLKKQEGEQSEKATKTSELQSKIVTQLGVGFTFLLSTAIKFAGTIDKIGQTFGSLNVLGKEVTDNLLESSVEATKLGGSIDDVASITNTLASNFGMSLEEASALSAKVFDTSKAIGLSADESANLFGVLTQTANLSAEQAEQLAEGAFQLARQRGVAPNAVLKDLAQSAETIAQFTKDGGNNIAEAAVQARSLGVSLDTTAKISKGLLDFESSLTNEIEASVMIGKQLNFERARQLALEGDIAGATKDVVAQLGSEAEFNKLNVLQREALAKSIGVSVGELAKLVGQSDKLSLSGAMAAGNFEDLLGEEGISNITKLTQSFSALGATLTNSLGPILSVVAEGLNFFGGILQFVVENLEKIGALAPIIAGGLAFIATKSIATAVAKKREAVMSGLASALKLPFPINLAAGAATIAAIGALISQSKTVNDFHSGPGGITHMTGPAGTFELNPRDYVLATTNPIPVNDMHVAPAGQMNVGNVGGNSNSDGVLTTLASAVNGLVEKGIGVTGTFDNFGDAISFAGERQPGTVSPVGTRVA